MVIPEEWKTVPSQQIRAGNITVTVHGPQAYVTPGGAYFVPFESLDSISVRAEARQGTVTVTLNGDDVPTDVGDPGEALWAFPACNIVGEFKRDGNEGELVVESTAGNHRVTVVVADARWLARHPHELDG